MERLKVVHVGTGFVGTQALGGVIDHPDLELVGLVVHDPGKVGRDAGELAGLSLNGVSAVGDLDAALGVGVDVVSYFATTHGRLKVTIADFCRILSSGVNKMGFGAPSRPRPRRIGRPQRPCSWLQVRHLRFPQHLPSYSSGSSTGISKRL